MKYFILLIKETFNSYVYIDQNHWRFVYTKALIQALP